MIDDPGATLDRPLPAARGLRWIAAARAIPPGERTNALSHAFAAVAFLLAGIALTLAGLHAAGPRVGAAVAVFATSLVLMYAASARYHGSADPARKPRLRQWDHCCIYLLIAGSYTPFAVMLGGGWGLFLLVTVWVLAALGIAFKLRAKVRRRWVSTALYIAMGWLVVVAAEPMLAHFPSRTMTWLLLGGIAYTAGTPFYMFSRVRWLHPAWHGFVILGSACHFIAVASALAPAAPAALP